MMDDLIRRQATIDAIAEMGFQQTSTIKAILCRLETLPSAQPERKTGKWAVRIIRGNWNDDVISTCSECGTTFRNLDVANYCPNCGAQMEVKE